MCTSNPAIPSPAILLESCWKSNPIQSIQRCVCRGRYVHLLRALALLLVAASSKTGSKKLPPGGKTPGL